MKFYNHKFFLFVFFGCIPPKLNSEQSNNVISRIRPYVELKYFSIYYLLVQQIKSIFQSDTTIIKNEMKLYVNN